MATESIYDGTGSLVSPMESCWGCDKDEAKMHPHKDKTSTVTFQSLRNELKCKHIDISTDNALNQEVMINIKDWGGANAPITYRATINKTNGVSIDNTLYNWSTIAITTTQPIDQEIAVYAYCRDIDAVPNDVNIQKVVSAHTKLTNDYYHLGNASLITKATNNGEDGFGIGQDVSVASKKMNSINTFQVYNFKDCKEVEIRNGTGTNNDIKDIFIKGWSEPNWSLTDCTTLPCSINTLSSANGNPNYTLVKIETQKSSTNGRIYATCMNKDTEIELKEKVSKPLHPNDCKFDDVSTSTENYKYITAMCSVGIVQGYGPDYKNFGPDNTANWVELTKVVNLTHSLHKVKKFVKEYSFSCYERENGACWYEPYIELAKEQGFGIYQPAQIVTNGVAYQYISKVFWNQDLTETNAYNFLKSKGVTLSSNLSSHLIRKDMVRVILKSAKVSSDESGIDRKLPYINHVDEKLDDKGDIPNEVFQKPSSADTDAQKKTIINDNIKNVVNNNITLSQEGTTDNLSLVKNIIDIKKEYDDMSAQEIIDDVKSEGVAKPVSDTSKIESNSVVELVDNTTGETILAPTSTQKDEDGNAKIVLETSPSEIDIVSKDELKKESIDIKSQTPNEYLSDTKDDSIAPNPVTDTINPTGSIYNLQNITQGTSSVTLALNAQDDKALSSMQLTVSKDGNMIETQPFSLSGVNQTVNHTLYTSSYAVGTYTVILSIKDAFGNVSNINRLFSVIAPTPPADTTKPTGSIAGISSREEKNNTPLNIDLSAFDNTMLSSMSFVIKNSSGSDMFGLRTWHNINKQSTVEKISQSTYSYPIGTYTAILTIVDKAGNTTNTTQTFNILAQPLTIPTNVSATDGSYTNKVRISWSGVNNATSYYIYRATSATGTYGQIANTASTYYDDSSITSGTTYYYKVKAYNSSNYSDYSGYDSGYYIQQATPSDTTKPTGSISTFFENIKKGNKIYLKLRAYDNASLARVRLHIAKSSDITTLLVDKLYEPNSSSFSASYVIDTYNFSVGQYEYSYFAKDVSGNEITIHGYFNIYDGEISSLKPTITQANPSTLTKGDRGRFLKIYGSNMDQVTKVYIPGVINLEFESAGNEPNFYKSKDYISIFVPEVYGSGGDVPYGDRPITLLTNNGRVDAVPNLLYVNE